jgi:hypothetical protein
LVIVSREELWKEQAGQEFDPIPSPAVSITWSPDARHWWWSQTHTTAIDFKRRKFDVEVG